MEPELQEFLDRFQVMPDDEMVRNPPGLTGLYLVRHLRRGFKMHAICVHSSGMGLAATIGRAWDHWCADVDAWLQSGPFTIRDSGQLLERAAHLGQAVATEPPPMERSVTMAGADPWRFE